MGDDRSALQRALADLSAGLRSALGLEPSQPELIEELLERRDADGRGRVRAAPRRRRPRSGRTRLVVAK